MDILNDVPFSVGSASYSDPDDRCLSVEPFSVCVGLFLCFSGSLAF
jgi:hypothetical protein